MSTIKINELATASISLSDFFAKADANGLATKTTIQELSSFLSTTGDVAFQGSLAIADTPSADGWYFASESGTYTNAGSLVVDITDNVVIIIVSGTQTVFEKIDIPISLTIDSTPTASSVNAVQSGGTKSYVDGRFKTTFDYSNNSDAATMQTSENFQNNALSDYLTKFTSNGFVGNTSPSWRNESSTFSGWGWGVGVQSEFDTIKIRIRGWDGTTPVTQIRVRVRENNKTGTILEEKLFGISDVASEVLTVVFDNSINNANPLWVEYVTDGHIGWYGDTVDVASVIQAYTVAKDINGNITDDVTPGFGYQCETEFLLRSEKYYIDSDNKTKFKTDLDVDDLEALFYNSTSFDSQSSVITPTISAGNPRTSPFAGWGADFNLGGVSFNALKIQDLRRGAVAENEKWQFIKVFVKNDKSDATNLAESDFIRIDKESSTIDEILMPLKDSNDDYITLSDGSFSGATYFIGYILYNENYEVAYGGEVNGTQSNYAGDSYYSLDINSATWTNFTNDPCVPFEHILLVNPVASRDLIENIALENRVETLENSIAVTPRIILPDSIEVALGYERQFFYNAIIEAVNLDNYNIKITGDLGGKQYPRYYEFTLNTAGSYTFTVSVYDLNDNLLITDSCSVVCTAVATSPVSAKKVLCVGDSLTSGGIWTGELERMLAQSGGVPSGLNLSNIDFIGTVGTAPNLREGYGGKTWNWFISETVDADVTFTVASHDKDSSDLLSIYQDGNGNNWILESILSATELVFSRDGHILSPPASGTLTHISGGVNTTTITYSSYVSDVFNPFYNTTTNQLDFSKYVSDNGFGSIDYACILLTWNGQSGGRYLASDHATLIADAKTFLDALVADYPSVKVKLMGIQLPSPNGGLAANYGDATNGYGNYYDLVRTVNGLNLAYQDLANEPTYSSFVEFVNVSMQFDNENNMPTISKAVNLRNTDTEVVGSNGVHPKTEGYYQIADAIFNNINKEL